jgi:signal transduction histidine kinase
MRHPATTSPTRMALESAVLYTLLCSTYILLSGLLASHTAETPQQLHVIETIKGIAFVVATGGLFFTISCLRLRRIRRQEETIILQERGLLQADRRLVAAMSVATVAHDLNNLLMALSGLVKGLKDREGDDTVLVTTREKVEAGIEKLRHLAKRLALNASRAVPETEEDVDLKAALHELVAVVRQHPDVRFCRISSSDLAPISLVLNRTLFEEAVMNLLINAAQASGLRGQIEVHLTAEPGLAILEFHDNGPGVPDALVQEIFEPCFTTKPEGTGIGLLTVTAFAGSCGAQVSVGRSPLGGALFRFRIPTERRPSHWLAGTDP